MKNIQSNFVASKSSHKDNSGLHLVFTSIITEKRRIVHKNTEEFTNRNRVDIFLSTLDSIKSLPIETAEFYLEFDETTHWGEKLSREFISALPFKTKIINKRLEYFKDWQKASESLLVENSKQILLFANDDHYLVPGNLEEFQRIMKMQLEATKIFRDKQIIVPVSHFPESHAFVPISKAISRLIKFKDDLLVPVVTPIGAVIMSPKDFKHWFESDFTADLRFVGPENPFGPSIRITNGYYLIPKFEMFRHFDAYSHIGLYGWPYQVMDTVIQSNRNHEEIASESKWITTKKLRTPSTNIAKTYLIDSKISGDRFGFAASILKSNSIRLSLESIKSINEIYKINKFDKYIAYFDLMFTSQLFRRSFIRFIYELPILLLIKTLFRIKVVRGYIFTNTLLFAIFINGSSHGYFRYFRILVTERYKKPSKNGLIS